jgi:hydroxymethylglutaryl-CoA lyase
MNYLKPKPQRMEKVILEDQGLRDGLQSLSEHVPTARKLDYINRLIEAGVRRLQVASFVHPKLVPQMSDAEEIIANLPKRADIVFSSLVLNVKGVERAAKTSLKHLAVSLSASETHGQKNARMSIAEAKIEFQQMVSLAQSAGITVRGGIQCAFGCRYEGAISEAVVLDLVRHHVDSGVEELALADSTGMGNPRQMRRFMAEVLAITGAIPVALHLHNTENKGYANVFAALDAGVRQFDTAFGGLGGCPFIKSATGNIATEDTALMLHQMGFETGIDVAEISALSLDFQQFIGRDLSGLVYKLV